MPRKMLAVLVLATSVALPATPARASERGPECVGYDTLEISPGLSATPTTGTVNHVGPLSGRRLSGTYLVRDTQGDCTSTPLTKFRADYAGYFNDNSRD